MCTVLYIPQHKSKYFASLRDESPVRVTAISPALNAEHDLNYIAPVDALAGGTWAGVNEMGNVIILLNGGFEKHERKPAYQKSRGLVVRELLGAQMPVIDWELMDMEGIEPCTLVVFTDSKLFQLVWDGTKKHRLLLDAEKPQIWSSSTLYNAEAKMYRADLFQNWMMMQPPISKISVLDFFKIHTDKTNGFLMNRDEVVKTLSYSFIEMAAEKAVTFDYYDFKNYKHSQLSMALEYCTGGCINYK